MKSVYPMFRKGILACLLIVTCHFSIEACSIAQMPSPSRSIVDPNMYIFVGEVIGYTEPIVDPGNFRGEAHGVKIKVIESIHIPNSNNDNIEVFMFSHGSDCFPETGGRPALIGTRYWFAIYPSTLIAPSGRWGNSVRLETKVFSRFGHEREMFGFKIKAESEFDYKNDLKPLVEKFREPELSNKRQWLWDFLFLEASKDLIRLAKVKTESERMRMLERLLYCPDINYRRLFFSEVGKPLRTEAKFDFVSLLSGSTDPINKGKPKKFSKREKELIDERLQLEKSGALNLQ